MQTNIAVPDTDQKKENAMRHKPNHGGSRKEEKMNTITKAMSVAVLVTLGLSMATVAAEVSPQPPENSGGFRGPLRNGIYPAKGLLKKWPAEGPRLLWEAQVGKGWTSASVADGRVFFCGGEGDDGVMRALDLDGKELWRTVYGPDKEPRATPTVAAGVVYYESVAAVLYALEAATGKVKWSFDAKTLGDTLAKAGGKSGSPLVMGDLVIFALRSPGGEADGGQDVPSFAAVNRHTGKLAWKGHLGPCPVKGKGWSSCNSSPIPLRVGGIDVAVCQFYRCAAAVRADNGERFWMELNNAPGLPKGTSRGMAQATANEGFLFVFGTRMLQVGDDGSLKELWEGKIRVLEYNISYSHTIIKDGRLIAFTPAGAVNPTGPGTLRMLDARTGEELASLACAAKGALAWADGLIYLLDNRPGMVLIEATKDSLREVSSFKPPFGKYGTGAYFQLFTPPVVAEGRLFLRDQSRVLVYDLRKDRYP
jgi:outer membrane protein assembly factor BamB